MVLKLVVERKKEKKGLEVDPRLFELSASFGNLLTRSPEPLARKQPTCHNQHQLEINI